MTYHLSNKLNWTERSWTKRRSLIWWWYHMFPLHLCWNDWYNKIIVAMHTLLVLYPIHEKSRHFHPVPMRNRFLENIHRVTHTQSLIDIGGSWLLLLFNRVISQKSTIIGHSVHISKVASAHISWKFIWISLRQTSEFGKITIENKNQDKLSFSSKLKSCPLIYVRAHIEYSVECF